MATKQHEKWYSRIPDVYSLPTLIEVQLDSFQWLMDEGLAELFDEISPIESYNGGMKLFFPGKSPEAKEFKLKYWFDDPKHDIEESVGALHIGGLRPAQGSPACVIVDREHHRVLSVKRCPCVIFQHTLKANDLWNIRTDNRDRDKDDTKRNTHECTSNRHCLPPCE